MGVKHARKVLGTGRDGQFSKIIDNFWKKWPTLQGPGRFSRDFIPTSIILKGYFIWIKFGAAQTGCIFEFQGHCAAQDWCRRKNPWLISYLWTKVCWKQFWAWHFFELTTPIVRAELFWKSEAPHSNGLPVKCETSTSCPSPSDVPRTDCYKNVAQNPNWLPHTVDVYVVLLTLQEVSQKAAWLLQQNWSNCIIIFRFAVTDADC